MAVLAMCGYDDTIAESSLTDLGGTSGVTGRSGSGICARRASVTSTSNLLIFPTALSTFYFGVAVRTNSATTASASMLRFIASDGTTTHFRVGYDTTGAIVITGPAGTVVATSSPGILVTNTWAYLEVKGIISDTVGVIEVRIGETVVLTYSGDTRNGTPTTVQFVTCTSATGLTIDFDDSYVDDAAYQGDLTVLTLTAVNNGDSSGWLGSDGNSTDNYLLVDDPTTSNLTDYVAASASGTTDLYQMSDIPTTYDVLAIQETIYAAKSDAGTPPTVLPVAKGQSGTVRTDTALATLSTTGLMYTGQLRTTDPDGNPLTAARVNAMQIGAKIP